MCSHHLTEEAADQVAGVGSVIHQGASPDWERSVCQLLRKSGEAMWPISASTCSTRPIAQVTHQGQGIADRRIEPMVQSGRQTQLKLISALSQLPGVFRPHGERLLAKDPLARLQGETRLGKVVGVWGSR